MKSLSKDLSLLGKGMTCWCAIAGSGTGSMVTLYFGKKVLRERPLKNFSLADMVRKYEGEYCLFLVDCLWRIQDDRKVVASSASSNHKGGEMLEAVNHLIDDNIIKVDVDTISGDLVLYFSKGLKMLIFCYFSSQDDSTNYRYYTPKKIYDLKFNSLEVEIK
jgi:hypothetical protein